MNPDDGDPLDEQFSELLAAYHEALTTGRPPESDRDTAPPPLRGRLAPALTALRVLE
jgi:hypothetical protein